jgi:hypothetical protein
MYTYQGQERRYWFSVHLKPFIVAQGVPHPKKRKKVIINLNECPVTFIFQQLFYVAEKSQVCYPGSNPGPLTGVIVV